MILTHFMVYNGVIDKKMKVDTGSPVTILNIDSLARILGYDAATIERHLKNKAAVRYTSFTKEYVSLYPCLLRNVIIGDTDLSKGNSMYINDLVVFVTLDKNRTNLLGLDIISSCKSNIVYRYKMTMEGFDSDLYARNIARLCCGINPYEINELIQVKSSISGLLSKAEGS